MSEAVPVEFYLNGKRVRVEASPNTTLLDLLRRKLRVTSVRRGCETGECSACTVLLDGKPVNSCLVLAPKVEGREVVTVEGISGDELHFIQKAFMKSRAVQCGFCIPGLILVGKALFDRNPNPSLEEMKKAIEGNYCRCTGYIGILEALQYATQLRGHAAASRTL